MAKIKLLNKHLEELHEFMFSEGYRQLPVIKQVHLNDKRDKLVEEIKMTLLRQKTALSNRKKRKFKTRLGQVNHYIKEYRNKVNKLEQK